MSDALVIIPTYNEIENIETILRAVFSQDKLFHVLVVDDNSPDGTADKVKSMQQEYVTQLHLLQRDKKSGLGAAYISGFKWALQSKYEFIFEMCEWSIHQPASNLVYAPSWSIFE